MKTVFYGGINKAITMTAPIDELSRRELIGLFLDIAHRLNAWQGLSDATSSIISGNINHERKEEDS